MIFDKTPQISTWFSEILHSSLGVSKVLSGPQKLLRVSNRFDMHGFYRVPQGFVQVAIRCLKVGPDE